MKKTPTQIIIGLVAVLCLLALPLETYAASKNKPVKASTTQPRKERVVLMPLQLSKEDQKLITSMQSALVEGLQRQYEVRWGEEVEKKSLEVLRRENVKVNCTEERCMQGIAEAFGAELIATAEVVKASDGYFLSLNIQNILSHKVELTKTLQCKGCDAYAVIDKLKELVGVPATVASAPSPTSEEPSAKVNLSDPETALWEEAKKGNAEEDYQAYLSTYPKGKYVALAKVKLNRLKDEARAGAEKQDQQAWGTAQQGANQESYAAYLSLYPQGQFAALAQGRIDKIKREAAAAEATQRREQAAAEAKQKREAAEAASRAPQVGKVFKDCAECPEMVVVPAGSFTMGSNKGGDESPAHNVTIRQAFAMGKTEVTQGQWKAIMGNNPSNFSNCGDSCPVEKVSWDDAKEYIQKLNAKTGKRYRLPTEAEWEYACRAGGQSEYCGGENVDSVAWYGAYATPVGNSAKTTNPVATKQANAWGLYDMSGNVWEWVEDNYHDSYNGAPNDGTAWQGGDARRVLRGGSWYFEPQDARAAYRYRLVAAIRNLDFGFRLARMLP